MGLCNPPPLPPTIPAGGGQFKQSPGGVLRVVRAYKVGVCEDPAKRRQREVVQTLAGVTMVTSGGDFSPGRQVSPTSAGPSVRCSPVPSLALERAGPERRSQPHLGGEAGEAGRGGA